MLYQVKKRKGDAVFQRDFLGVHVVEDNFNLLCDHTHYLTESL